MRAKTFTRCPICGCDDIVEKELEKLLKGGCNTAIVRVQAEVCLHCGERLYSEQTILRFEEIRRKLESQETEGFRQCGKSFEVAS